MQHDKTANPNDFADISSVPHSGRLIAIDPGTRRIGLAVSDDTRVVVRRLPILKRSSWKKLLSAIRLLVAEFDAVGLVVGLPLAFEKGESPMAAEARDLARKFALSLEIPVYLQDERLTTFEARNRLWAAGFSSAELTEQLDSEAAALILSDFLDRIISLSDESQETPSSPFPPRPG
ncbi:MAG: Holliday junction resolvase RuvX [Acidobacteria bacterium]|nr:Holliday junction resolvase RuvX [Acidobacteriota bacterium]